MGHNAAAWPLENRVLIGGYWAAEAYSIGYLRALVQVVNNEFVER